MFMGTIDHIEEGAVNNLRPPFACSYLLYLRLSNW